MTSGRNDGTGDAAGLLVREQGRPAQDGGVESIKGKMEQVKLILLLLIHFTSNTEHIIILIRVNKK